VAFFGAFPNITCEQSHVVFPAAAWAERDGLFCSNDRALQWADRIATRPMRAGPGSIFGAGWLNVSAGKSIFHGSRKTPGRSRSRSTSAAEKKPGHPRV